MIVGTEQSMTAPKRSLRGTLACTLSGLDTSKVEELANAQLRACANAWRLETVRITWLSTITVEEGNHKYKPNGAT